MPNHYHLLLQTPEANLSRCMRHINGVYTQRFNRHHRLDGPLFRGRFKSILVGDDNYLIQLLLYICFNPVKAGMVKEPEDYAWSCYNDYISDTGQHPWLNRDLMLKRFQEKQKSGLYKKEDLLSQNAIEEVEQFLKKKNLPSILGSKEFVDQIRNQFFSVVIHQEKPSTKDLAYESKRIIRTVCHHFELRQKDILYLKRGINNIPRDLAIYLIRNHSMSELKKIAEIFHFSSYSGVSTAIERVKKQIESDPIFATKVKSLDDLLHKKSQKKT